MSKERCCGNCRHSKFEGVDGKGWCEEQSWVTECSKVCNLHEFGYNGWTEITPDNVDEIRKNKKNIVVMNPKEWESPLIASLLSGVNLVLYSEWGGYYYYVLPELKIE